MTSNHTINDSSCNLEYVYIKDPHWCRAHQSVGSQRVNNTFFQPKAGYSLKCKSSCFQLQVSYSASDMLDKMGVMTAICCKQNFSQLKDNFKSVSGFRRFFPLRIPFFCIISLYFKKKIIYPNDFSTFLHIYLI